MTDDQFSDYISTPKNKVGIKCSKSVFHMRRCPKCNSYVIDTKAVKSPEVYHLVHEEA